MSCVQAAEFGHLGTVSLLLARGADPNAREVRCRSASFELSSSCRLEERVNPIRKRSGSRSCCSKLLKRAHPACVACLRLQEEGGYRPLHEAAAHSHLEACRALLHGGAHLNAHTEAGESALDLTKEPFRSTFIELLMPQRLP